MAELREDFLTENWVCISETRDKRPCSYKTIRTEIENSLDNCPFCIKNRHMTPEDVFKFKDIRVVPNLYPILSENNKEGYGFHEVIIDTPDHNLQLKDYSIEQITDIFITMQNRIEYFKRDKKIQYIQIFKNHGPDAGATISHSHWQITALPFVPLNKKTINTNFNKYFEENKMGYFENECLNIGEKLVLKKNDIFCFIPYAPLYYCGYNILHKENLGDFENFPINILEDMAFVLKESLNALNQFLPNVSFNICFNLKPFFNENATSCDNWHFYIQVIPRLANFAGFEISTSCYINSNLPEITAKNLRSYIKI